MSEQVEGAAVVSVNTSLHRADLKTPAGRVDITQLGIVGDAHFGPGLRQLSLLDLSTMPAGEATPGRFRENITTSGLDAALLTPLSTIQLGGALLEVTGIGKACHATLQTDGAACSVNPMFAHGVFTRVLRGGSIADGAAIRCHPKTLRFAIIRIEQQQADADLEVSQTVIDSLSQEFAGGRYALEFSTETRPCEPAVLDRSLAATQPADCDAVFTIGATGIGPRDIAPETVVMRCSRLFPGVTEAARAVLGHGSALALTNRSVAGLMGHSLVFCLPDAPEALSAFLSVIVPRLQQMILALHGIEFINQSQRE